MTRWGSFNSTYLSLRRCGARSARRRWCPACLLEPTRKFWGRPSRGATCAAFARTGIRALQTSWEWLGCGRRGASAPCHIYPAAQSASRRCCCGFEMPHTCTSSLNPTRYDPIGSTVPCPVAPCCIHQWYHESAKLVACDRTLRPVKCQCLPCHATQRGRRFE